MYGIDQNTSEGGTGFIGIQENFELIDITYGGTGKDGGGAVGLMFNYRRGEKFNAVARVYPVDESKVKPYAKPDKNGKQETQAEAITRAYAEKNTYIKHILGSFIPKEEIIIPNVSTFEAYCKAIIALAGKKYEGQKFRIKLTYNKKGFSGFPDYPRFVENMSVPANKSLLKITDKDIIEKPVADSTTGSTATGGKAPEPVKEF